MESLVEASLITQINDWLVDQALGEPDVVEMFDGVCRRLSGIGMPIARARLTWSTLHPLFRAETVVWDRGKPAHLEQFIHQDTASEAWLRSPYRFMLDSGVQVFRRRLAGPGSLLDFPILEDLAAEGYTDYIIIGTELFPGGLSESKRGRGIFVVWTSDRPTGFSDHDLVALQRIQRRLAIACKTVIQARIARNITEAYLGRQTGAKVLDGLIRLGDGEQTRALVWFSDLRNSTFLAEMMPSAEFIELLNAYFECAARPVIAAGGEVLAFVGDAVLAIFPVEDESELPALTRRALSALRVSLIVADRTNAERAREGRQTFRYGIGLNIGPVMYGNIGVPERLAFSAVGPTVIEVARIEKLTKTAGARVLATREVADFDPHLWRSVGKHALEGLGHPQELFGFREEVAAEAA
jgi:adenylate cyclase